MDSSFPELWAKGRDPIFFAESILGVALNPAQRRWLKLLRPDENGNWRYHRVIHVSGNQVGKSLGVAMMILWATAYKIGLDVSQDPRRWAETPYYWFHVAPQQAQAYIPLRDIELLVKGAHPAQVKECRFPAETVTFATIETGYSGFTTLTGAVCQFRTTDEKAKALQGRRAHGISFDEAALENHLIDVIDTALSMRLISTSGPLLLVGTPDGMNDYYEVVQNVLAQAQPVPNEERVWAGDDVALVWSHVSDNVGYGITAEEAARKEAELPEETKDQMLKGAFLEPQEAFFVPSERIQQAFRVDLQEDVPTIDGHRYVIFWDPSVRSDPNIGYIIDVTKKPWVVVKEMYEKKPSGFNSLVVRMFEAHNDRNSKAKAITGYDATSMGGQIFREVLRKLSPSKALNFAGPSAKLDALGNFRMALLNGDLVIPASLVGLQREINNYRLDDKHIRQDRVMALAGAAWLASKGFSGVQRASFSPYSHATTPIYRHQGR